MIQRKESYSIREKRRYNSDMKNVGSKEVECYRTNVIELTEETCSGDPFSKWIADEIKDSMTRQRERVRDRQGRILSSPLAQLQPRSGRKGWKIGRRRMIEEDATRTGQGGCSREVTTEEGERHDTKTNGARTDK